MYPIPSDELERLKLMADCSLTGRPAQRQFDEIALLAATLFDVPIALVTLVDRQEQWFHGRTGLDCDGTLREVSFCTHAIAKENPFIVNDALNDARFVNNPLVTGDPHIRFYAGAPITSETGVRLGAVCIIDNVPRPDFRLMDAGPLVQLAKFVSRYLDKAREPLPGSALTSFAEATGLAILTADPEGRINSWNAAAERMFGHSRQVAIGQPLELIIPDRFQNAHREGLERIKRGGKARLIGKTVEVVARRADATEFPIAISIAAWPSRFGMETGAHIEDISERKASEAALEHLARHDQLTGLLGPKAFRERLEHQIDTNALTILMMLDLDGFKAVNDTLGHAVGDALLQSLAVRLNGLSQQSWTIGRLGGDEFAIILNEPGGLTQAAEVAASVLASFGRLFAVGGHRLHLGASIGMALAPDHSDNCEELIALADLAMMRAKQGGGNCYRLFDSSMRAEVAARRTLNDGLRDALDADQWELHYQPQFRLSDGALIGAEALLRWRHPNWGLMLPGSFMQVLETHLVAFEVGQWVLQQSCRQLAAWRRTGVVIPRISCNLFGAQVYAASLAEDVEAALIAHKLSPADLELEITETIALGHDERYLRPLFDLVDQGVGVALDDFGTGYGSLSTLTRAPITRLKIDRSFVKEVSTDRHSEAVVAGIVAISEKLDVDVVAEGVENEDQRRKLLSLNCFGVQGYLYGRPMAGDTFAHKFTSNQTARFDRAVNR